MVAAEAVGTEIHRSGSGSVPETGERFGEQSDADVGRRARCAGQMVLRDKTSVAEITAGQNTLRQSHSGTNVALDHVGIQDLRFLRFKIQGSRFKIIQD